MYEPPRKKSLKLALEHVVVLEEKENIYMQNKISLRCTNPILRIQGFAITISYFSLCLYICIYHFNPNWIFLHELFDVQILDFHYICRTIFLPDSVVKCLIEKSLIKSQHSHVIVCSYWRHFQASVCKKKYVNYMKVMRK